MKYHAGHFDTIYNYSWDVIENYFTQVEYFENSGAWIQIEEYVLNTIDDYGVDVVADALMRADSLGIHLTYEIAYDYDKLYGYIMSIHNLLEVPVDLTEELFNPLYEDFYDE